MSCLQVKRGKKVTETKNTVGDVVKKLVLKQSICKTNFKCLVCAAEFVRKDSLLSHLNQHKKTGQTTFRRKKMITKFLMILLGFTSDSPSIRLTTMNLRNCHATDVLDRRLLHRRQY